jgi:hypothetical protein
MDCAYHHAVWMGSGSVNLFSVPMQRRSIVTFTPNLKLLETEVKNSRPPRLR